MTCNGTDGATAPENVDLTRLGKLPEYNDSE